MKKRILFPILIAAAAAPAVPFDDIGESAEFVFARVRFNQTLEAIFLNEAPWHHDHPYAEDLYLNLVRDFTSVRTSPDAYEIFDLDDEAIFGRPFPYFSEPGFMALTPDEEDRLRDYFNRGGFAMFDDFRGADLAHLAAQLKRLFPDREMFRLDVRHPIFNSFYQIDDLDMIPLYGVDVGPGGQTVITDPRFTGGPEFWGMDDEHGRLILIANQNNDLGEYWEGLDLATVPFEDAADSVRLGTNYLIYAMTH